ncbi:MAG: hypothetical protein K5705_12765 [Oscillospiraceae bacterium]|nr:hypothetical protein [Oscillospiraceae bacterium]
MYYYADYQQYIAEALDKSIPVIRAAERGTLSFTPYISNHCSAACRFCSEKLYSGGIVSAELRVCSRYREKLTEILCAQRGRSIFLSVSGMEPSESIEQLSLVSDAVRQAEQSGCVFTERVMYSNLSGFAKNRERLTALVRSLKLTRIECSRHHFDDAVNQTIVRFKDGETIRQNSVFTQTVRELLQIVSVTMVCVMQKTGIAAPEDILSYLEFARQTGVRKVVFRALSIFTEPADGVQIAAYITENRVEMLDIIRALPQDAFRLMSVTEGYYYYSFRYQYRDMQVMFEMSDYDRMHREHHSERRHKLIFYPNGELFKDWNRTPEGKICEDSENRLAVFAEIAKELTAGGDAAVIGSFGAWLTVPQVLDHTPNDLDLFVKNDIQTIRRMICILQRHGFSVYSWQDRIDGNVPAELLKGRYYIRGSREGLHVDLTYEIEGIDYESMKCHAITADGIGTYEKQGLMRLLAVSDRADLQDRLERMQACQESCDPE